MQKCICCMGMHVNVTEEKCFLVTFHLEFGSVARHYKHNSILMFLIGIVKKPRGLKKDLEVYRVNCENSWFQQ